MDWKEQKIKQQIHKGLIRETLQELRTQVELMRCSQIDGNNRIAGKVWQEKDLKIRQQDAGDRCKQAA